MRLYHTSDLHDRHGFAPRLKKLREERPGMLFDCGDALRGSQTLYKRTEPIIAEMDDAGYDAQSMGNREFHYIFKLLQARAEQMNHPLLCTNLRDTKNRPLPFVPSLRFETPEGITAHVLGALIMQYPAGSPWERLFGWRFLLPWDAIAPYAAQMPQGDALIVLSHIGLSLDRELAARVPRIDIVLGGHSHDTLAQPQYVGQVPIVHAGPYGKFVSRTEMGYDAGAQRFRIESSALVPLLDAS